MRYPVVMPATLNNVISNGNGLRVFCGGCGVVRDLNVYALAERYGGNLGVPEIGRRARCQACGHLGGQMQVVVLSAPYYES